MKKQITVVPKGRPTDTKPPTDWKRKHIRFLLDVLIGLIQVYTILSIVLILIIGIVTLTQGGF